MAAIGWWPQVCLEYLERYYVLIAFSAYLMKPGFDPANPGRMRFGSWLAERPELYRCLSSQATSYCAHTAHVMGLIMTARPLAGAAVAAEPLC